MNTDSETRNAKVLVLVPCFNEEGRIGNVVRSVRRVLPAAGIAVVNDSSSDGSAAEAASAGAVVLSHGCNLGYGAALETGYAFAISKGYDVVLQMDGDGQHIADELPALLAPVLDGSADLVIGSRYGKDGKPPPVTVLRRIGHRFFSIVIRLLTGMKLSDPTSGFQCMNRRTLSLFSSGVFPCDYPDSDVILMVKMSGLRIQEVPVEMRERAGGTSMHSGLKPIYYGMKMLLSMFIVLLNYAMWRRIRMQGADKQPGPANIKE